MATILEALATGLEHHQAGRFEAAEQIYRHVLAVEPKQPDAMHLLGVIAHQSGKPEQAVEYIRRAIELQGNTSSFHYNLGNAFADLGNVDEAVACYGRALALKPDYVEAHFNLGNAYQSQGRLDEAVACYRRALQIRPDCVEPHTNLGTALKTQGKLDEAIACYRRAIELRPDFVAAHSSFLCSLYLCPDYNAAEIYAEHRRWNQRFAEPLARLIQPHSNEPSLARRLRIGYFSLGFREGSTSVSLLPLLEAHDRERFEIFCYASVRDPDTITDRCRVQADVWRNVLDVSDEEFANTIRQDRIDILVDLTMQLADHRLLAFARKPAPVQVTWLGYVATTGLTTIDYRLTDAHLDPPGLHDQHYSEESVCLPDSFWLYDPLRSEPDVNALPALKTGYITFGCLNSLCKINASVLKHWARVLKAVDRSQIVLLAPEDNHRRFMLELLQREGVTPDRVMFVARRPPKQYLELYHGIDITLDTLPYNGHITSLDSLWMGVPVVTMVGRTVVGRGGVSLLMNLGLPELIADSPEQFVCVAAELANDRPRLSELRATLRERMLSSPLMDAPRFARNVEAAYRTMWQRWCDK